MTVYNLCRIEFGSILSAENNESKLQNSLIQINIENILLAVMDVNQYMLLISLVSLLKHNNMIEENKYCGEVIKNTLLKNL